VVDVRVGGQRAGRGELGAGLDLARLDEPRDVVGELLRDRRLAVANEVQHAKLV
jgi:hypothetical protein